MNDALTDISCVFTRGVAVGSRLACLFPERHLASVFISLSYMPPDPQGNGEKIIKYAKEHLGMDLYSYWAFFASEDAPRIMSEHVGPPGNLKCSGLISSLFRKIRFTVFFSLPRLCFGKTTYHPKVH